MFLSLVLREIPRLGVADHLVGAGNNRPGRFERTTECKVVEMQHILIARGFNKAGKRGFVSVNSHTLGE